MRKLSTIIALAAAATIFAACNHLTSDAKKMVGNYYMTITSEEEPAMELNADGTCLIRAIRPGVLTYTVEGEWNVKRDSLIIDLQPKTLKFTGDSTMIGNVPRHTAMRVVDFNGLTLTLNREGANYIYRLRGSN